MYEKVKALIADGQSRKQIAEHLGITLSALNCFCSRNGLQSRKSPAPKYDVEEMRNLVEVELLQQWKVAQIMGLNRTTVERACRRHGIKTQRTGPRKGDFSGESHPGWKGGRIEHRGYVRLHMPEHPQSDAKGYYDEHRVVAESILGRYLSPVEVVHHIDNCRSNNDPSNLEVFAENILHLIHHNILAGQSPADAYMRRINLLQNSNFHFGEELCDGRLRLSCFHQKK